MDVVFGIASQRKRVSYKTLTPRMAARTMRFNILTFIAYEALWFAVVIGAARGYGWLSIGLALCFIGWQLVASTQRDVAWRLVGIALVLGAVVDGGAHGLGLVQYASAAPALPPGGAPLWILGLWASFGVTLAGAFRWIAGKPVLGAVLGAVGGPLSYLGAARGWATVTFASPTWHGLAYLAGGWAIALAMLALAARTSSTAQAASIER